MPKEEGYETAHECVVCGNDCFCSLDNGCQGCGCDDSDEGMGTDLGELYEDDFEDD